MSTRRTLTQITRAVIHCSATPNGQRITVDDIDRWHAARGFRRDASLIGHQQPMLKHIGYHFVIYTRGAVTIGRGLTEVGAHVLHHNHDSIGICLVGTDRFSAGQWASLDKLIAGLSRDIPTLREVVGHRDLSPDRDGDGVVTPNEWLKRCPGFDVRTWFAQERPRPALPGHLLETRP